jgi:beta-galactosidase
VPIAGLRQPVTLAGGVCPSMVPRTHWRQVLAALHAQGLPAVDVWVPWAAHAPAPGRHDFTGDRDLGAFLDLVADAGLRASLRIGPVVHHDLALAGLPRWVVAEPGHQARTAHDTPAWWPSPPQAWPLPSAASAGYLAAVGTWYAALAEVVLPRQATLSALAVDHHGALLHRTGAYDLDYHPDALAWWREDEGDLAPPRRWDPADAERCVRWVRFKERYAARGLAALVARLGAAGLGHLPRWQVVVGAPWSTDLAGQSAALGGPLAIELSAPRAGLGQARRRVGHAVAASGHGALAAIELGRGLLLPPVDRGDDPERPRDLALIALAGGVRGLVLASAVERARHAGAPIDRRGQAGADAAWLGVLARALATLGPLQRRPSLAVVLGRADERFGRAAAPLDPVAPVLAELIGLGPLAAGELHGDDGARRYRRWLVVLEDALELAGVDYELVDERAVVARIASADAGHAFAGVRALIVPSVGRLDRALAGALRTLAAGKRPRLVVGPDAATQDELGQPLAADALPERLARLRPESLDDLAGLAADLAAVAGVSGDGPWHLPATARAAGLRLDRLYPAGAAASDADPPRLLVLAAGPRPHTTQLTLGPGCGVRDLWTGERPPVHAGQIRLSLPAHGVQALVVEPGPS